MPEVHYTDLPGLVGESLGPSDWLTIDQPRIDGFAEVTEDRQWIHVDQARAAEEMGGTIAHGFLTLSLLPRLAERLLVITGCARILNVGVNKARFTAPVASGARIRLRQRVLTVRDRAGGREITTDNAFEVENGERPVCVAESVMLALPEARGVQ